MIKSCCSWSWLPSRLALVVVLAGCCCGGGTWAAEALVPDGTGDLTGALAKALAGGGKTAVVPAGRYRLGALAVPAGSSLIFQKGAVITAAAATRFTITGDHVLIQGVEFDLAAVGEPPAGQPLPALIAAAKVANLVFRDLSTAGYGRPGLARKKVDLISLAECRDIEVSACRISDLNTVVRMARCARVQVFNNRAEQCDAITVFAEGSEYLRHRDNWSNGVTFQCMWWGGDCDDNNAWVTPNSARIGHRGLKPGAPGYVKDCDGAYDINISGNYAENGTTLAWGSKGRNVILSGNIARFMADMAYDTEGGENVVISNNIAINSKCAGIGCYFYGERLLISGNQVLVLNEGAKELQGGFVRLHSPSGHFGNGEVLVTGNQFISEVAAPAMLSVEAARSVLIKNNTFKNGGIVALPSAERVLVDGCVFDYPGTGPFTAITFTGGRERLVTNCTFRRNGRDSAESNRRLPALLMAGTAPYLAVVKGNLFTGWSQSLAARGEGDGAQFFVVDNLSQGRLDYDPRRTVFANNHEKMKLNVTP
jgi:hypothetical protein